MLQNWPVGAKDLKPINVQNSNDSRLAVSWGTIHRDGLIHFLDYPRENSLVDCLCQRVSGVVGAVSIMDFRYDITMSSHHLENFYWIVSFRQLCTWLHKAWESCCVVTDRHLAAIWSTLLSLTWEAPVEAFVSTNSTLPRWMRAARIDQIWKTVHFYRTSFCLFLTLSICSEENVVIVRRADWTSLKSRESSMDPT